jgi:Ca-activated chloride channel family protein
MPRATLITGLAVCLAAPLGAQEFRSGTDVVLLSVTVTDGAGRHVPGLVKSDFQIYEDGVLQDVSHFSPEPEPVSLSLLIDSSGSMEHKLPIAQQAASGFIGRLGPKDVAQVVDVDNQTRILTPFTSDKAVLDKALTLLRASGSTAIYNALYTAISELKRQWRRRSDLGDVRRQAIILLSDGEDTSSVLQADDMLDAARRSDVIVYAIAVVEKDAPPSRARTEAVVTLRSVTRDTGGRAFFVNDPRELPALYLQISDELANQYSIGYSSKNTKRDGTWRRLTLQVLKGDATPRTRAGYYAPSGPR